MSFIDELKKERQAFAKFLSDPEYSGIRRIVEDLYPDRAHFIFELLQNAEDVGATEAKFILCEDSLTFEHDGAPFTQENVRGITNIGKGSKDCQDEDVIGRFGVGFKAVFAYTETPHIWSPTYSFSISEWIVPNTLPQNPAIGDNTRFTFPFDNKKKAPKSAYTEILAGLNALSETTLLFLSHIESVSWQINDGQTGELLKCHHNENHVEVLKQSNNETTASSHYLSFSQIALGSTKHHVSIAYALDLLPTVKNFDSTINLSDQLKIVPSVPGRVFVYFPAEKETSGLRFHLNAPFVPDPSRASIKQSSLNDPLFSQLAELAAESLHKIKQLDLLSVDFLGVLPNYQETLPADYEPIRKALTAAMNEQPLTPTYSRLHFPAKYLLQSRVALKELLSEEDISFLFDYDDEPPRWAMSAPQKNSNTDRFLSGLAITKWDVAEFNQALVNKSREGTFAEDNAFAKWLSAKPIEWHQRLYALLYKESISEHDFYWLRNIPIVRLNNGSYEIGTKCFFPSSDYPDWSVFLTVDIAVYSSGKSKLQQDDAKTFLHKIGVQDIKVEHIVMTILNGRYTKDAQKPEKTVHVRDLRLFFAFLEMSPDRKTIFSNYYILKGANGKWYNPSGLYLDKPYLNTELNSYYRLLGENTHRQALSQNYVTLGVSLDRTLKFAKAVGVQHQLSVEKTSNGINSHPLRKKLAEYSAYARETDYAINEDWTIPGLAIILKHPDEVTSRMIWNAMRNAEDDDVLTACYRPNRSYPVKTESSSLVILLRDNAWVPQKNGVFVKPAQASRDRLPKGFPFDSGEEWLKAVHFGEEEEKRSEEHRKKESAAKEFGFKDADTFDRAKRIMEMLSVEDQIQWLHDLERKSQMELPEHESKNPERRAARIAELAQKAPERSTEKRLRSVPVGLTEVKVVSEQYLRDQYTIDGEMICQICGDTLPFKRPDGLDYFETVEFLDEDGLKQRHYQNYLALCPNHRAMFKHANGSKDMLKEMLSQLTANELEIILAEQDAKIYFTKMHLADLKTVIETDESLELSNDSETAITETSREQKQ